MDGIFLQGPTEKVLVFPIMDWHIPSHPPSMPLRWFSPNLKGLVTERPVPRTMHACASIREKVFIFGGLAADGSLLNDVWVFDQDSVSWSNVNCYGSLPSARQGIDLGCNASIGWVGG